MKGRVLLAFVLLGLTSLTADMVYEGARSVSGAYLEHLGAPPAASAAVGAGELLGYALRLVSGLLAVSLGSSAAFWGVIVMGYALNVFSLPLLALTGLWWQAALLYLFERVGKGLRAPLRDVLLAEVSEGIGRGKGFGIHEVMDQVGALIGPLLFAFLLARYGYPIAFLSLLIPGLASVLFVVKAWSLYPKVRAVEARESHRLTLRGINKAFWLYSASMALQALGFVHWAVASYFLKHWGVMGDAEIATLYAVAMAIDALVALPAGHLYDLVKLKSLPLIPITTLATMALLVTRIKAVGYAAAALWGVTMGFAETVMRASVADLVNEGLLALAYGVFGLVYGVAWTLGGFAITVLLQMSVTITVTYVALAETLSMLLMVLLSRALPFNQKSFPLRGPAAQ